MLSARGTAALDAAAAGIPVFPCWPGGKSPHGRLAPAGVYSATRDEAVIRDWWTAEPDANIGLAVGAAGLAVLDVDGKTGEDTLTALELMEGVLPRDMVVRTPRGGFHIYMASPPLLNSVSTHVGKKLDVRSVGGYVLGAGSETEDGVYTLESDKAPSAAAPLAPKWFIERAKTRDGENAVNADADLMAMPDASETKVALVRAALERQAAEGDVAVQGGGGDLRTFEAARLCRSRGLSPSQALEVLDEAWNPHCDPPWDLEELAGKVRNAYRYASEDPPIAEDPAEAFAAVASPVRTRRSRFAPMSWSEMRALPPMEWLIRDTLPMRGRSMLTGAYGSYKSFFAASLALDLSVGVDTLALRTEEDEPASVRTLYVAGEGFFGIRQRVAAWATAHEILDEDLDRNFRLVPAAPALLSDVDLKEFIDQSAEWEPRLVVFDTLSTISAGVNENDAGEQNALAARLLALSDGWECNVMVVHHDTKSGGMARGSTALPAAMDTVLRTQTKGKDMMLSMPKQKDAAKWEDSRRYRMEQIDTDFDASLVLRPAGRASGDEGPDPKTAIEKKVHAEIVNRGALLDQKRADLCRAVLRDVGETMGVRRLAMIVAERDHDDEGEVVNWLRREHAKYLLKDVTISLDSRGRIATVRAQS